MQIISAREELIPLIEFLTKDLKNSDGMEIDRKMERFYSILSLQLDFHHAQKMHFEISGFEDLKLA